MQDQIGTVLHWSNQEEPNKQKAKMKSSGGTWIGIAFQLLLLYTQTHPDTASETFSKNKKIKEPRFKKYFPPEVIKDKLGEGVEDLWH